MRLAVTIPGRPQPQGSKRHVGRGVMVESNAALRPWRADAVATLQAGMPPDWTPIAGPVRVQVTFVFARPKAHFGTGRNAAVVKPGAPYHHHQKPDADKLLRAVLDAATTAGVWRDDSQVSSAHATKAWGEIATTHLLIEEQP